MQVKRIRIAEIDCGGPYVEVTWENTILTFADSIADGHPIVVYERSQKRGYKYTLACGFHRIAAAEHVGMQEIMAVIIPWEQDLDDLIKPNVIIQ